MRLLFGDLGEAIAGLRPPFDAICVDVDNGPGWLVHERNAALYDDEGLAALAALLGPGGRLSVWSAHDDDRFEERLRRAFASVIAIRVGVSRGPDDVVYVASRSRRP